MGSTMSSTPLIVKRYFRFANQARLTSLVSLITKGRVSSLRVSSPTIPVSGITTHFTVRVDDEKRVCMDLKKPSFQMLACVIPKVGQAK
jgi:hypothetical protein